MIRVALAGNPNVGKSVIFNNLTGSRQHVGNWPGKTVEKKEGYASCDGEEFYVVDLPGTYSLTAYSVEELIARDFIVKEKPDVVVIVVDASNIERNLYLVLQVLELGVRAVVALNKIDLARSMGVEINVEELEKLLGIPVVPTVAPRKQGMKELCEKILEVARRGKEAPLPRYGRELEEAVGELEKILSSLELKTYNIRWLAIKLIEGDKAVEKEVERIGGSGKVIEKARGIRRRLERKYGDPEIYVINERYRVIQDIVSKAVKSARRMTVSDLLDQAFLDKYLGIPVFLTILWILFQFTFIASTPLVDLIGDLFAVLSEHLSGLTGNPYVDYLFFGEYGVLNGIGMVLSFVPLIMALYFALSLFEDFGYMARAAFLMDKIMRKLGLTGRTIIPMILGFGCNVAGIYGTRIIPEEEDRIIAVVTNPLMMCSARLAAFAVIAAVFWQNAAGSVLLSLYVAGIALAIVISLILKKLVFRGKVSPFIMELPPYQAPSLRVALTQTWMRGSLFFRKAGTVILLGLIVVGVLAATDASTFAFTDNVQNSLVAALGRALQPLFAPLGWDWRLIVAVVFGFVAKEIVIGATAMLYGVSEDEFASFIAQNYDPVTMYAYMVFVLIYVPCVASIAAIKHETGSWKWTAFTVAYEVGLAYLLSVAVTLLGRALAGV